MTCTTKPSAGAGFLIAYFRRPMQQPISGRHLAVAWQAFGRHLAAAWTLPLALFPLPADICKKSCVRLTNSRLAADNLWQTLGAPSLHPPCRQTFARNIVFVCRTADVLAFMNQTSAEIQMFGQFY